MAADLAPDWILKAALATQDTAHRQFVRTKPELRPKDGGGGLTLAVLGCGTMGIAVLSGILNSLQQCGESRDTGTGTGTGTNAAELEAEVLPSRLPTKFNACVRSARGSARVHSELDKYDANLYVFQSDNVSALEEADIVLLACEPDAVEDVLSPQAVQEALAGKLLISILAGVSQQRLYEAVCKGEHSGVGKCTIVRAMPNTAAAVRESMTVLAHSNPPLPEESAQLVDWIFTRVGKIVHLPESSMNAGTALCGAGPAFCALVAESLAAGAIRMGIPREEAYAVAAQVMRGTAGLLQQGEHPALLRDKVCTPGGGTIAGLQVLEAGALRATISSAVAESAKVVGQLE